MANNYCYVFNTGDAINGAKPFQQLVTMDAPQGELKQAFQSNKGLTTQYDNRLYYLPLPGDGEEAEYNRAPKAVYKWKSKKFVFPGRMTLAAGKVVKDCGGVLTMKLYVDCKLAWTTEICDCKPFRLPPEIEGIEFEVELIGTARVVEVHLASSMRELIEHD